MSNLTELEAIRALLETTSEFSPQTRSSTTQIKDENTPIVFPVQDSPLSFSNAHELECSKLALDASGSAVASSPSVPLSEARQDIYHHDPHASSEMTAPEKPPTLSEIHSPILVPQEPLVSFAPPSPALCRSISRFNLVGTLGCGSYGKVLLGNIADAPTGISSLQAIKVLRKRDMHRDCIEEVKRELRALRWIADTVKYTNATQQHQDPKHQDTGVVFLQQMFESFQNDNFVFIVLEYHPVSLAHPLVAARLCLPNYSLSSEANHSISKSKSLPLSFSSLSLDSSSMSVSDEFIAPFQRLQIVAAELSLGLIFLHQSGIVHQDIKPANIMISSGGHVVIADFGASTALPFSFSYEDFPVIPTSRAQKTFHPVVLNPDNLITFTPLYAAPELVCRNKAGLIIYDSRVDWWSLGVVLYELATGSTPFVIPLMTGNCPSAGDSKQKKMKRRSLGDFSVSFGAMEKLLATLQGDDDDRHYELALLLQAFIRALLVDRASDRLAGEDVKTHPLFESISHLWVEIAALEHPPLPGPPEVSLDPDTSLDATLSPRITSSLDGTSQSSGGENQLDSIQQVSPSSSLKITWPVLREGLLADDPINLTADPSNLSTIEENSFLSHSLHDTTSIPAHTSEDVSFLFIQSEAEDVQDDVDGFDENGTEDGTNSQASPLQPFPSTASLHSQLRTQEQDQEVNPHPDTATNSISEAKVGDTNSSDLNLKGESEDVEIWNPWIPRPADGPMYASESLASRLPNPYSPQPALSHHLESARDFQSLQCISSVDSQPKLEENLLAATSETKPPQRIIMKNDTPSDELATADHDSAREDTGGPDMQIPGFKTPPIRLIATRLHSNPPLVSSSTPTAEEDIMFFNASKQTRSKSLSILSKGRNGGRSFPRFSLSARSLSSPSDANHTSVDLPRSVEAGIESPQKDTEDITNKSGRTGKAKNRFSLPISFPNPRIKQANGDQQEQRHPWHKRRFSAPLLLKSKGPPSSFHTVKIRSQINPVSLLNMPVPPSDIAPMSKNKTSSTVSPALSSGISLAGANILPFSAQELDRMRLEYQKRRATDPIPMPRIRADNSHYTEFATFGRSSGSRMLMMAQARASATANAMRRNCQSEEGARHPSSVAPRVKHGHSRSQSQSSSRTGVLCPSLQDELTMSVLSALDNKSGESRDFTTMTTVRSSRTYRSRGRLEISAPMRVHSLHQGRSEPRLDDGHESESVSVLAQAGTLRGTNRASWAGMMGSHHNIQHPSGPEELQRRPDADLERAAVKTGQVAKKDPPCPPPMSRDYFNSTNQLSPGPARASVEVDGKTVFKRRSLRSRLWKKFKQLAFL